MNELQAAYGLLQLDMVDDEIARRGAIVARYREELKDVPGIRLMELPAGTEPNHAYFPIRVSAEEYGMSRDELHDALKSFNVITRKYFHPLCSHYSCYSALPSSRPENLPVAERAATEVLCLPLFGTLPLDTARTIGELIRELPPAWAASSGLSRP